ncbi:hypothetical protein ACFSTH_11690 [Paenibacillus yanchengensis]|uniref:Uncharacterized protein n=1 Tax=Paenibacillus yanchengensis TaxID=2035833 RepID=A0ABW4YQZ3_9BACL
MMFAFEKEIAEREMLTPVCSYSYQVISISDQAKLNFGLSLKKRGPIEKLVDLFKKGEKLNDYPFVGQITFFHDDLNEKRIEETKELAQLNMARYGIKGINYTENGFNYVSFNASLREGKDYKIKVGEKIIHEQPRKLTFDDIKVL